MLHRHYNSNSKPINTKRLLDFYLCCYRNSSDKILVSLPNTRRLISIWGVSASSQYIYNLVGAITSLSSESGQGPEFLGPFVYCTTRLLIKWGPYWQLIRSQIWESLLPNMWIYLWPKNQVLFHIIKKHGVVSWGHASWLAGTNINYDEKQRLLR